MAEKLEIKDTLNLPQTGKVEENEPLSEDTEEERKEPSFHSSRRSTLRERENSFRHSLEQNFERLCG